MKSPLKIGIIGIGGIGGFIGAPLARKYHNSTDVEIIFICRGKTKERILAKGLTLHTKVEEYTVQPHLVSDDPTKIGTLDVAILATKSHALETVLEAYKPCFEDKTVIISLQNMVNAKEVINNKIRQSKVLEGCIYVASNAMAPGHVKHVGGPGKIFVGSNENQDYSWLINTLVHAGIDISYVNNIPEVLWKKYLFVAPVAAVTTAYNITFGELRESEALMFKLRMMMAEIQQLALSFNATLTDDAIQTSLEMLNKFPHESKSSLQVDFENKVKQTEAPFLIDFVTKNIHGVATPYYKEIEERLSVSH